MRPTVGLPLGMFTSLAIFTVYLFEERSLSLTWGAGCLIMMIMSFVLKHIIDRWEDKIAEQKAAHNKEEGI